MNNLYVTNYNVYICKFMENTPKDTFFFSPFH